MHASPRLDATLWMLHPDIPSAPTGFSQPPFPRASEAMALVAAISERLAANHLVDGHPGFMVLMPTR
jgi:hypothetical protein